MAELSIIVPIYNVEAYLSRCIDSILAQTFTNFELILINDGSPDHCAEIMEAYAKKDARIITIHQENQGVSAARNAGLKIATGKYVGFVDPDDCVYKQMYSKMLKIAEQYSLDIVCCNWTENEKEHECEMKKISIFDSESFYKQLFEIPKIYSDSVCNKIYRKDYVGEIKFRENVTQGEDYLFLNDIYDPKGKMGYIPECLYFIYGRIGSATKSGTWKRMQALEARRTVAHQYKISNKEIYYACVVEGLDLAVRFEKNMLSEKESRKHITWIRKYISNYIRDNVKAIILNKDIYWKTKILYLLKIFYK